MVISDQADHLGLIRRNARANGLRVVMGDGDGDGGGDGHDEDEDGGSSSNLNPDDPSPAVEGGRGRRLRIQEFDWVTGAGVEGLGARPFDVVLGTDVAYCPELYAPVVKVRTIGGWLD